MKEQLLQYVMSFFTKEATQKLSQDMGENHGSVVSALESTIPTIFRGFANYSSQNTDHANQLMSMAQQATGSGWWSQISNFFTGNSAMDAGSTILKNMFGHGNIDKIADGVASHNNIKASSAMSLMQWAAPLCLGALGKHAADNNLDAGALASSLSKINAGLDGHVPSTLGNVINSAKSAVTGTANAAANVVTGAASAATNVVSGAAKATANTANAAYNETKKGINWLLPLLLLAALACIIWFALKGCGNKVTDAVTGAIDSSASAVKNAATNTVDAVAAALPTSKVNADGTVSYTYGDSTEFDLNGVKMRVPSNGSEAVLITKIKDALANGLDTTDAGKKSAWINLYDVQFTKGLTYRNGAMDQIKNIATILKAYPGVHIKLGGYTDSTGAADLNKKLSGERANKVMKDINIGAQIDKAEGYGSEFPVGNNATVEGRAQNRRVSCRITSAKK